MPEAHFTLYRPSRHVTMTSPSVCSTTSPVLIDGCGAGVSGMPSVPRSEVDRSLPEPETPSYERVQICSTPDWGNPGARIQRNATPVAVFDGSCHRATRFRSKRAVEGIFTEVRDDLGLVAGAPRVGYDSLAMEPPSPYPPRCLPLLAWP